MQLFYLSGILTVFFCGIVMSHYTWHNVTENSRVTTKYDNTPRFNNTRLVAFLASFHAYYSHFLLNYIVQP